MVDFSLFNFHCGKVLLYHFLKRRFLFECWIANVKEEGIVSTVCMP